MFKSLCLWLKLCTSITGPAVAIDGDTIVVKSFHVRLAGIDAEELNEPYGLRAKAYMQTAIGYDDITCYLNGERSYDRFVGTCYTHGIDLGWMIVNAGYALDCAHYSRGKYRPYEPAGARERLIQKPYC